MKHPRTVIVLLLFSGYLLLMSGFCLIDWYQQSHAARKLKPYAHDYLLPSEAEGSPSVTLDINTASMSGFVKLPGVSRPIARQIISYRKEHGDFKEIAELLSAGMPESLFYQIEQYFYVAEKPSEPAKKQAAGHTTASSEHVTRQPEEALPEQTDAVGEVTEATEPAELTISEPEQTEILLPLELNQASVEEFCALQGIGPVTALAIVEYRESIGGFVNCRQLLDVQGIGEVKFEQILPFVYLETEYPLPETEQYEEAETDPTEIAVADTLPEQYSVNLNTATKEDLLQLPGCDDMLAEEILVLRDRDIHVFYNIAEITLAEHVTKEVFAAWMPYLTVDDDGSTQIPYIPPLQSVQEAEEIPEASEMQGE